MVVIFNQSCLSVSQFISEVQIYSALSAQLIKSKHMKSVCVCVRIASYWFHFFTSILLFYVKDSVMKPKKPL